MKTIALQLHSLPESPERNHLIQELTTKAWNQQKIQQYEKRLKSWKNSATQLNKALTHTETALKALATIVQQHNTLDRDDEAALQLIRQNDVIFQQVHTLAGHRNHRALSDLRALVHAGHRGAIVAYAELIHKQAPGVKDDLAWIDQHPAILQELPRSKMLYLTDLFETFLTLAETMHNPFALEILTHEIFSIPAQCNPWLQTFREHPLVKNCCIALHASIPADQSDRSIPTLSPEEERESSQLQRWLYSMPHCSDEQGREIYLHQHYDLVFKRKVLFAHLVRQQTMVAILTRSVEPLLPAPVYSKDFPPTSCWLVGVPLVSTFSAHEPYVVERLTTIGQKHHISVVVGSPYGMNSQVQTTRVSLGGRWIQDHGDWAEDRGDLVLRTLALTPHLTKDIRTAVERERKERNFPIEVGGTLGHVQSDYEQCHILFFAHKHRIPCAISAPYAEGGNTLIGTNREGQRCALVGKDTVAWVKEHIAQEMWDLGYARTANGWILRSSETTWKEPSEEEIKLLLAHHYGIDPDRIVFCEQPAYHLDVAAKFLGNNTIMLNDSWAAAQLMLKMLKSKNTSIPTEAEVAFLAAAHRQNIQEKKVADDLKEKGFIVLRFGGNTYHPLAACPETQRTNLFNFVSVTTPEGKKLIIAMGCPEAFQTAFRAFIAEQIEDDVEIEFLDEEWSKDTLSLSGGIECMVKLLSKRLKRP